MSFFRHVKRFAGSLIMEKVSQAFPGISAESLKQGWIPIPASAIQEVVRRKFADIDGVDNFTLTLLPGRFHVNLDTSRYRLKHRVTLDLRPDVFMLNAQDRKAVFLSDEDMDIEGRNLAGKLSVWLAAAVIEKSVSSRDWATRIHTASQNVLEVHWPVLTVHLDNIEEVRTIFTYRFADRTLFDLMSFGPLTVHDGYASLKVGTALI